MTEPRPTLDVSHLPPIALDMRSPSSWGDVLFMVIETTSVVLLIVSYYYTKQNFPQWPPPHADDPTGSGDVLPGLGIASVNAAVLLASCPLMAWVDRAARRGRASAVKKGLLLLTALGSMAIALRIYEFSALKFRWDDNAYGSLVWAIVFMHLTYLVAATLEVAATTTWIFLHGMDESLAD